MRKYLEDIGVNIEEGCVYGGGDVSILTDSRAERFKKQIEEYGFDDRETWNLHYTSACWLYEHLMMYKEIGGEMVNLSFHKFKVKTLELKVELTKEFFYEYKDNIENVQRICEEVEKTLTQEECIDTILDYLKYFIQNEESTDYECSEVSILEDCVAQEKLQAAFKIYAEIINAMWW